MKAVIDRFEGDFAVCEKEDRTMVNIMKSLLPQEAGEGDVIVMEGQKFLIDAEETRARKKKIEKIAKDLWD